MRDLGWQCLAYCVMSTHAHLVLCTPEPNLGIGMRRLQGRYASAHNRRHDRRGHLFGRRYWSRRIDRPHYLACAALYAVLNPVAAGLCAHPVDFAWSSYRETAAGEPRTGLLEPEVLLRTFADDVNRARGAYRTVVEQALAANGSAASRGRVVAGGSAGGARSPDDRLKPVAVAACAPPHRVLLCVHADAHHAGRRSRSRARPPGRTGPPLGVHRRHDRPGARGRTPLGADPVVSPARSPTRVTPGTTIPPPGCEPSDARQRPAWGSGAWRHSCSIRPS